MSEGRESILTAALSQRETARGAEFARENSGMAPVAAEYRSTIRQFAPPGASGY